MNHQEQEQEAKIAALNDFMRQNIGNPQGADCVVMSRGLKNIIEDSDKQPFWIDQGAILKIVENYNGFGPDNDPYGERDFGTFIFKGTKCFWKIDYYALDMMHGSENPADSSITARVLTIATLAEY